MPGTQSSKRIDICKICFEKIEDNSFHYLLTYRPTICHKCFMSFSPKFTKFYVDGYEALSLFDYDETIKEKLYQFKGCGDYELRTIFLEYFLLRLKIKYFGYILVPAPSYITHNQKRGFNHVISIFESLSKNIVPCVHKNKEVKQSDLNANERKNIGKYLFIDKNVNIKGKKILIVDDVFTTGSTVKAMIKLIEKEEPKKLKILVLSKTILV